MSAFRSVLWNWREGGFRLIVRKIGRRIARLVYCRYEAIVYRLQTPGTTPVALDPGVEVRELTFEDLVQAAFFKALAFPDRVRSRFHKGELCVGVFFDGELGHVSWMTVDQLHIDLGLPDVAVPGGAGIYDMFTLPAFRGRGAQTTALLSLCRIASERGLDRSVALVREGNAPSRHVFRKCGFEEIGTLSYRRRLWFESLDVPAI